MRWIEALGDEEKGPEFAGRVSDCFQQRSSGSSSLEGSRFQSGLAQDDLPLIAGSGAMMLCAGLFVVYVF